MLAFMRHFIRIYYKIQKKRWCQSWKMNQCRHARIVQTENQYHVCALLTKT